MIYLDINSNSPYFYFGLEYFLAKEKVFNKPVLFLWQTEPSVMLGKYQNIYEEINLDYILEEEINLVRRNSGGGTIYTDLNTIQFSIIDPDSSEMIDFEKYIRPLINGLNELGIDAEFKGRNDILIDGKKISGNAQYKLNWHTIHHGSILFDTDLLKMAKAIKAKKGKIYSKAIESVRVRVTNISKYTDLNYGEFKNYLINYLADERLELNEDLKLKAYEYGETYFNNRDIIYGRNPKFTMEKAERLPGGMVKIYLEIDKNIIKDIEIRGDFFTSGDINILKDLLIGIPYEKAYVKEALVKNNRDIIKDIKLDNLLELIFKGLP